MKKTLNTSDFNETKDLKEFLHKALFKLDNSSGRFTKISSGPQLLKTLEYLQTRGYDIPLSMREILKAIEQYNPQGIDYDIQVLRSL